LLNSSALRQLPPARVVLAIDPHDEDPEERLRAARTLRESGYSLTLLDFAPELGIEKYLGLVDAVGVKTDRDLAVVSAYLQRIRGRTLRMIAREVATRADWAVAEKAGFRYFHGAYFLQPAQE
jgi:c-di-GMP-related signal transduction protein